VVEIVVVVLAVVVGGGGKPAPPIWTIEFAGSPRNVATKKSLVLGSNSSPHGPTPSPEAKRLSVGLVRSRTRHRDRAWRPFRRKTLVHRGGGTEARHVARQRVACHRNSVERARRGFRRAEFSVRTCGGMQYARADDEDKIYQDASCRRRDPKASPVSTFSMSTGCRTRLSGANRVYRATCIAARSCA